MLDMDGVVRVSSVIATEAMRHMDVPADWAVTAVEALPFSFVISSPRLLLL